MSLENVKEGDFVFFSSRTEKKKSVVQRATKTQLTVEGRKFTRHGRRCDGDRFDYARIEAWDEDLHPELIEGLMAELELKHSINALNAIRWHVQNLSLDHVRQILALLESFGVKV